MFQDRSGQRASGLTGLLMGLMLLGGCANVAQPGPEPDTAASVGVPAAAVSASAPQSASAPAVAAAQGDNNASPPAQPAATTQTTTQVVTKTVWYRARRGDTLKRVAQKHGCSVKDLIAWNRLKPSSRLRPGQSLKIVTTRTVTVQVAAPATGGASTSADAASERQVAAELRRHARGVSLVWPAQGQVVESFQPGENRGIEIAGKAGDPVRAAADGKVMYAGTGLNGYGSLIIVQHNKDFLTAYSHNRRLLVKTGDIVRQGQQIAEMGSEDNSRVAVMFELRHDGKPVDPMPYLPRQNG